MLSYIVLFSNKKSVPRLSCFTQDLCFKTQHCEKKQCGGKVGWGGGVVGGGGVRGGGGRVGGGEALTEDPFPLPPPPSTGLLSVV
jgi:hypothetical protein